MLWLKKEKPPFHQHGIMWLHKSMTICHCKINLMLLDQCILDECVPISRTWACGLEIGLASNHWTRVCLHCSGPRSLGKFCIPLFSFPSSSLQVAMVCRNCVCRLEHVD